LYTVYLGIIKKYSNYPVCPLDGGAYPKLSRTFMGNTNKPFNERTEKEKDELYERIAEQLSTIADQYNLDSPNSPDNVSSSDGALETVAPPLLDAAAAGAAGESKL